MESTLMRRRLQVAAILAMTLAVASALAQAPSATLAGPATDTVGARMLLAPGTPSRVFLLAAPDATERGMVKATNTPSAAANATDGGGIALPLTIGFGREFTAANRTIRGADLTWTDVTGGRAARIDVSSEGAAAIRVALSMRTPVAGAVMRFSGSADPVRVFGPVALNSVSRTSRRDGVYWSPVLEGATGSIEIFVPAATESATLQFDIVRLSHLVVGASSLDRPSAKDLADLGKAGACELNFLCAQSPVVATAARYTTKIVMTRANGQTFTCTGTLLNDTQTSGIPYFYTASHCADSQAVASTMVSYWFFFSDQCEFTIIRTTYDVTTDGARLLARSQDGDWALLRLNSLPPDVTLPPPFAFWRADPVLADDLAITLHYPMGDARKYSRGRTIGDQLRANGSTVASVQWEIGSTEPGSDGAGLFTLGGGGAFFEFRGSFVGGNASCANPNGTSQFSPLSEALPLIRQYLAPDAPNPTSLAPAVEFYNQGLDHYFLTSSPAEIADLDSGAHAGWVRTGFRFFAYANPAVAPADAKAVCRFYRAPAYGDSHFYSASATECAATAAAHPIDWIYESPNVFYIQLPDPATGACPAATRPVYRFFSTVTTNHRYVAEVDARDVLRNTPGWIAEGYGPEAVIMCSPKG